MSPQEELFVELYFEFKFNAAKAYRNAGYAPRNADANAYSKLRQAHIQAAIMRRRFAMREIRSLSREEKLEILECMVRNERLECRDRLLAMRMHNDMVGERIGAPEAHEVDRMTAAALRALPMEELIEQINRGMATRVLPSPIIDKVPAGPSRPCGNGKG